MKLNYVIAAAILALLLPQPLLAKETKDIKFTFANADPVVFSHDIHLLKYHNNCRICHNTLFNLKSRKHYTMAEMEKTRSCGACHTGMKAFSVATEKDCVRCHKGKPRSVTYKIKNAGDAVFSHEIHIDATDGKCKSCHNGKVITGKDKAVTMTEMEKGRTCGACHNGKAAFTVAGNCGKCHEGMTPRTITFKIKGINDATFSHTNHLGMFKCNDCHTRTYPYKAGARHFTMAEMDKGKSCGTCHNGGDAFTTAGNCDTCHKGFKPANITFKNEGGEVSFSHDDHSGMYKCADCHTKRFPFKAGTLKATMTQMEAGTSCGGCHNGNDAFSVKGDCEKCHKM
jgi:c(7)-type cytochrome triheme protein